MNELNQREQELVVLGAALGSNCIPCIEHHIPQARRAGLSDAQIAATIRLGDTVRRSPARKVLDAAMRMLAEPSAGTVAGTSGSAQTTEAAVAGKPCCGS